MKLQLEIPLHLQRLAIFIATVVPIGLLAQSSDNVKQMLQADAYYEAGMYAKARDEYQSMLQEPLEPWERAIIMYDLGNVWLAAGEWEQAETTYHSVSLDNPLAPLLSDRIQRNLMLNNLRHAVTQSKNPNEFKQSVELLNKVIEMAPASDQAYCGLQKAEGAQICNPSFDAAAMKIMAQEHLAALLQLEDKLHAQKVELREGLEKLLSEVNDSMENGDFLEKHKMTDPQQARYSHLFVNEQNDSLFLWTALKQKLQNDKRVGNDERKALFVSAAKEFIQGNREFTDRQFESAHQSFEKAADDLKELISKLPPPPPSASSKQKTPPSQQNQAPEKPDEEEKKQAANKMLQLLQRMEQEDGTSKTNKPIRKKELRPW